MATDVFFLLKSETISMALDWILAYDPNLLAAEIRRAWVIINEKNFDKICNFRILSESF